MRLDRGTLVIAVVATVVAVVLARVSGVLPGVLVAVATGLASAALWQLRLYRLAGAARAAELRRGDKAYSLPGPIPEGSVAQFLRPEEEVVSFWPRSELNELIEWIVSDQHIAIHLVTGEGGTGKTRLARQLTNKAIELEFRSWWVPDSNERIAVNTAREAGLPVLLVVDYAEIRTNLQELLAEVTSDADGPDLRVLLLARSAGEWWQQLISSCGYQLRELLAAIGPINLGPVSDRSRQSEVFNQALVAFADKLEIASPNAEIALADPDAIVLVVHAAALLAVLEYAYVGSAARTPGSRTEALAGLLRHEARYWQQTQVARNLGLDAEVTRRTVAAGCLVGADDEISAIKLLTAVADLPDPASRGKAARWLHDLYPVPQLTADREWIGSLQPDLIAEQLVVSVLSQQTDLIPALFKGLTEKRATRALTILGRAALTDPMAEQQLDLALASDLEHLAVPALTVAVETNPVVGRLLGSALASTMLPTDVLERIAHAIPYPSFTLAETAVVVFGQLAESKTDNAQRARWIFGLGRWLSELGRREEALAAAEEAVSTFRELAAARPEAFLPDLARSLISQSKFLSELGRREEALAAAEEAVSTFRELAAARPDAFLNDLARSLNNQSLFLSELGRREEALATSEEAVSTYRELAAARPDAFLPDLARSLNTQSLCLSGLGRREEALATSEEAVSTYRELAAARPDAFLPDLARSLNNQSSILSELGRPNETTAEEAVSTFRQLAAARPDAFLPDLAMSLGNQSVCLSELGRREEALAASEEAVSTYRELAAARPEAFLPDLAWSLIIKYVIHSGLGRQEEALATIEEAVSTYGHLAATRPNAFLNEFMAELNNWAGVLAAMKREPEAAAARLAAVELNRKHDHLTSS